MIIFLLLALGIQPTPYKDWQNEALYGSGESGTYEVLATLIKTVSDTTKDLYELQKKTKDLKSDNAPSNSSVTNIDKAVFVGSTSELLKQIKKW